MERSLGTSEDPGKNDPTAFDIMVHGFADGAERLSPGGAGVVANVEDRVVVRMSDPDAGGVLPPYASYSSWVRLLDALASGLPAVVDEPYLASLNLSDSSIKPLRSALRFLGLVARDGRPTERLHRLVAALHDGGAPKAEALRDMVHRSYRPLFTGEFDLRSAATDQLRLYFGTMGARGQIQQKCNSFFLNLARDAGLELPPQLISRSPLALGRQGTTAPRFRLGEFRPPAQVAERVQSAFAYPREPGLFRDLFPSFDIDWPEEKKQRWFRDFARLVKICERDGEPLIS